MTEVTGATLEGAPQCSPQRQAPAPELNYSPRRSPFETVVTTNGSSDANDTDDRNATEAQPSTASPPAERPEPRGTDYDMR